MAFQLLTPDNQERMTMKHGAPYTCLSGAYTSDHLKFDTRVGRAADLLCAWIHSDRHVTNYRKICKAIDTAFHAEANMADLWLSEIDSAFSDFICDMSIAWAEHDRIDHHDYAHDHHIIRISAAVFAHEGQPYYDDWVDPAMAPSITLEAAQ